MFVIPGIYKYAIIGTLVVSVGIAAFFKGIEYEQGRHSEQALKALNNHLNEALERQKKDAKMLERYAKQRDALRQSNSSLQRELQNTLKNPVYRECKSTQETADKLNELLK